MNMNQDAFKSKSILYLFTDFSSFVKNDYHILSTSHQVSKYQFKPVKGVIRNSLQFVRQFFYLLFFGWKYDLFFAWFADYHTFLPILFARLTGKKAIIVVGGYDVCRDRRLKYGAYCSPFRGWFGIRSLRMASVLIPVSSHVERKVRSIAPKSNRQLIFNCVAMDGRGKTDYPKQDMVLTVALIQNERTFLLKGIDTYIETARLLPGFRFDIVGINQAKLAHKLGNLPVNVHLHSKVRPEKLTNFYRSAKIYCQLSRSESFGVSIAEAMSFGVFPIVTNEGGMPEVIGKVGAVVERDPKQIADLILEKMLKSNFPDQQKIRQHVDDNFSLKRRTENILQLINSI
ncbi:MAG: glycosyltransferase family 4 protein [Marinilabiliales bacterium]|nr:glycosyltransferase family 4 protein [Marinilabiliales bacterium]